jgi:hypothetical protein
VEFQFFYLFNLFVFLRFHPWNAEPDAADAEVGTVKWVYNNIKKNSQRWETGENEGGSLGAEVVNGTLFNSTKDQWTSVFFFEKNT